MSKPLRYLLKFWRQKDREPEDVLHHFKGRRCISECESYLHNLPLLKAIAYEWLQRNLGIRTISELATALDIHTIKFLMIVLDELHEERKIALSIEHQMLSKDWAGGAGITVDMWLKQTAFEQANG